jgi:hypothetical protein
MGRQAARRLKHRGHGIKMSKEGHNPVLRIDSVPKLLPAKPLTFTQRKERVREREAMQLYLTTWWEEGLDGAKSNDTKVSVVIFSYFSILVRCKGV